MKSNPLFLMQMLLMLPALAFAGFGRRYQRLPTAQPSSTSPLNEIAASITFSIRNCPLLDSFTILKARLAGLRVECARLRVPSDWNQPFSSPNNKITLFVRRVRPASGDVERRLFFVPGGPGEGLNTENFVGRIQKVYDSVLTNTEFLMIDHRGTGLSTRLNCGLFLPLGLVMLCFHNLADKKTGPNFRDFSVYNSVMDYIFIIDRLRARDPAQVPTTLHGVSYGGYFTQRFLQLAPRGFVENALIQSSTDLESDVVLHHLLGQQRVYDKILLNCRKRADQQCPFPQIYSSAQLLLEIQRGVETPENEVCVKEFRKNLPFLLRHLKPTAETLFTLLEAAALSPKEFGFKALLLAWKIARCDTKQGDQKMGAEIVKLVPLLKTNKQSDFIMNQLIFASEMIGDESKFKSARQQWGGLASLTGNWQALQMAYQLKAEGLIYQVQPNQRLPVIMQHLSEHARLQPSSCLFLVGQLDPVSHLAETSFNSARSYCGARQFVIDMGGDRTSPMKEYINRYLLGNLNNNILIKVPQFSAEPKETDVENWPAQEFQNQALWYHDWKETERLETPRGKISQKISSIIKNFCLKIRRKQRIMSPQSATTATPSASTATLTCHGRVDSPDEARLIVEACLRGQLPSIDRRLTSGERQVLIRHGSVFVFEERKSRMRRWTDGRLWSPSRIAGEFLVYRECERKRDGITTANKGGRLSRREVISSGATAWRRVEAVDDLFLVPRSFPITCDSNYRQYRPNQQQQQPLQYRNNRHPSNSLPMGHAGPLIPQVWSGSKGTYYLKPGGLVKKTFTLLPRATTATTAYTTSTYTTVDTTSGAFPFNMANNAVALSMGVKGMTASMEIWHLVAYYYEHSIDTLPPALSAILPANLMSKQTEEENEIICGNDNNISDNTTKDSVLEDYIFDQYLIL